MEDLIFNYNYMAMMGRRPRKMDYALTSAEIVIDDMVNNTVGHITCFHMEFVEDVCRRHPDISEDHVGSLLIATYEEAIHTVAQEMRKPVTNIGYVYALGKSGRTEEVVVTVYPKTRECLPKIFIISV